MKIAIDVQTTRVSERVGMGSYVENLTRELKQRGHHQYRLHAPQTDHDLGSYERFFWDQLRFPIGGIREGVDIIHQPAFSAPLLPRLLRPIQARPKVVVTVHDLIVVNFPGTMPFGSRMFFSRWMPFTYRFADAIICDSAATRADLLRYLPDLKDRAVITVVHLAADQRFAPVSHKTKLLAVKGRYRTGDKFILHVGTLEPRKNLPFLVKVFAEVIRHYPMLTHNLVITGKKGWYFEELFELVRRLRIKDRVVFSGYVGDDDLPILYAAADLFLFPSKYEGFGLPPLEAMQSGTPVIVANNSSLPEVVGEAGILLKTSDEAAWVRTVSQVLHDPKLRKKLSGLGLEQARHFSWQKTAEMTENVYELLETS